MIRYFEYQASATVAPYGSHHTVLYVLYGTYSIAFGDLKRLEEYEVYLLPAVVAEAMKRIDAETVIAYEMLWAR